jgi:NAD(P)-dependent dehydrogenase (short-subunit alcohol dehydrogenase family)
MFSLNGRVALITGSSRGLGMAMAKALAEQGALVLINGREQGVVNAGVEALNAAGLKAEAACFDLADSGRHQCGHRRYYGSAWPARYRHQQCRHPTPRAAYRVAG